MWRYVMGATLGRVADEGARVGLVLLAVERTGSAAFGGTLVAALLLPQVVAAPIVGRVIDGSRRRARAVAALVVGFSVCLLAAPALVGRAGPVVVLLVLVAGGAMAPAVTGGLSSLLGELVEAPRRARAYGVDSAVYSVCGVAGPAAVGVVSTAWGPLFSLAALAAGGLVGGLVVWRLPEGAPREPGLRRPAGTGRQRWAGVSAVLRDPWLSAATMASSLAQVGLGALGVVVAVLASREQRTVVAVLLLAALPCGALLGSLSWMWRPGAPDLAPTLVVWGQLAVGVPIAVSAAVAQPVVVALLLAVAGVTLGRSTGALFLTRERRSPADAAGQVFAVGAGLKLACGAVGAVSVGLVADVDARWLLLACGAVPIVASVVGGLALRSRRGYAAVVP